GERPSKTSLHSWNHRRRHAYVTSVGSFLSNRGRRCFCVAVLRSWCRRYSRGEQKLYQDNWWRDGSICSGLLRLRLQEIWGNHSFTPALESATYSVCLPYRPSELRCLPPV